MKLKNKVGDILAILFMLLIIIWYIFGIKSCFWLSGDFGDGAFSIFSSVFSIIKSGELPLWLNNIWGGVPAVGNTVTQAFYPINLLIFSVMDEFSIYFIAIDYIIHIFILCIGIYFFLRINKISSIFSLISSSLVIFSEAILWQSEWIYLFTGYVWLPLIVDCVILLAKNNKKKWIVIGAICLGMSGLANQGQTLLINILIICWLYLCYLIKNFKNKEYIIKLTISTFCLGFLGICICAPVLLPAIAYSMNASRYVPDMEKLWLNSMEKISLEAFVKHITNVGDVGSLLQIPVAEIESGYKFGNIPFLLSFFGCIGFFYKKYQNAIKIFVNGIFIFVICYCIGLVFPYIFYYIPFYNAIREPFLYQPYLVLPLALYCALGLKMLFEINKFQKISDFITPGLMGFLLLVVIIGGILRNNFETKYTCFIVLFLLFIVFIKWLQRFQNKIYSYVFSFILLVFVLVQIDESINKLERLYTYKEADTKIEQIKEITEDVLVLQDYEKEYTRHYNFGANAYPANFAGILNFYDAFGYLNPVPRTNRLANQLNWNLQPILRNVKYWHTPTDLELIYNIYMKEMGNELIGEVSGYSTFDSSSVESSLLWKAHTFGVAWMVNDCIDVENVVNVSDDEIITRLCSGELDYFTQAYVNGIALSNNEDSEYTIEVIEYKNNSFKLKLNTKTEGVVVTSESWTPGWNVYINSEKKEVLQVNYLFKGVYVTAGEHIIEFKYEPVLFYVGVVINIGAILIIIFIGILNKYKWGERRLNDGRK